MQNWFNIPPLQQRQKTRETFSCWFCKQAWKLKKHVWQAQNLNYYWQILKRQLSLLCSILLHKSSTWAENLRDKTELRAWLSQQVCWWWHENETLQEVLHLLYFILTWHTQLVNCPSISSRRPTHAHIVCSGGVLRMALHPTISWGSVSTECHCQLSVFKHWEYMCVVR